MTALRVVVTGGSSGIGAELARQYAAGGARVAVFARRRDKLEEVAAQCKSLGAADTCVLEGDTTDPARVAAAAATVATTWGGIDRAFLNAGGYGVTDSAAMQRARDVEWTTTGFRAAAAEAVMRVNYLGVTQARGDRERRHHRADLGCDDGHAGDPAARESRRRLRGRVQPGRHARGHRKRRRMVRIWDASTGRPISSPLVHWRAVHTAAFSRDGTRVVTASDCHRLGSGSSRST